MFFLLILLAVNVILAALTFYIFYQDGVRLNWELKELVAGEVGGGVHLGIGHICQGISSDEICGKCFTNRKSKYSNIAVRACLSVLLPPCTTCS